MASVVDDLNELLARERGQVEAVKELIAELAQTDPDVAQGGRDALASASWACSGIYRRVTQLHGTPSLEAAGLAEEMAERGDAKSKLACLCRALREDRNRIRSVLLHDDLDKVTRAFLEDLAAAHMETAGWCESKLNEWRH